MWKIYYFDGSTFSDQDGTPQDAPADGIEVIAQSDVELGFVIVTGTDFYIWADRGGPGPQWHGVDIFGLRDFLAETGLVKIGYQAHRLRYREILERAESDPYIPKKTGYTKIERK